MRIPLMPLALALGLGGLLYAAFQGNKRLVDNVGARAAVTAPAVAAAADDAARALDAAGLDARCTAIAAAADAAALDRDTGIALEEFLRRPVVAFENDPALRAELAEVARRVYAAPPGSATDARRTALQDARCL